MVNFDLAFCDSEYQSKVVHLQTALNNCRSEGVKKLPSSPWNVTRKGTSLVTCSLLYMSVLAAASHTTSLNFEGHSSFCLNIQVFSYLQVVVEP